MPEYNLQDIDAEIARRQGGNPSGNLQYSLADIDAEIARREKTKTSTAGEIARPFLRAGKSMVAGTVGGLADLANLAVEAPIYAGYKGVQAITGDKTPYKPIFAKSSVTEAIKNKFDEATGGLTASRNKTEKALEIPEELLGSFVAPQAATKIAQAGTNLIKQAPKAILRKGLGITPKSQETLEAFQEARVTPRLADIAEGQTTKTFQNLLGNFPGSRGVIEKATQQQIDDISNQIAGITKSKGGTIQETGKVIQTGAQNLSNQLQARSTKLYDNLDRFVPEEKIPTTNLIKISQNPEIQDVAAVGAGDTARVLKRYGDIVDEGGNISYPRLKIFRSTIGNKLQSSSLSGDERSALKKIYGALSEDMKAAVSAKGGEAGLQAFNKANSAFNRSQEIIESKINPIIDAKTPEAVYSMALSGSKQGGSNIRGIMKTLDPEQKEFVRGTIARRMGLESAGGQDATGEVFNPTKFLTEWNKLSPEARSNIFTKDQASAIGNLNKAISGIKESAKARQSSNSLPYLGWLGLGSVVGSATATGGILGGATVAAGTTGLAHITARMMTNPKFINWLAKAPSVTPSEIPNHIKLLSKIAAANPDIQDDVLDYLKSITISEAKAEDAPNIPNNNDISEEEVKQELLQQKEDYPGLMASINPDQRMKEIEKRYYRKK
ncbi:MAG: hypothetical protein VKL60_18110 [Sphaerospermopsis sp.]|nr:hypothetical protein [Sphaerospermopsis sp.]